MPQANDETCRRPRNFAVTPEELVKSATKLWPGLGHRGHTYFRLILAVEHSENESVYVELA